MGARGADSQAGAPHWVSVALTALGNHTWDMACRPLLLHSMPLGARPSPGPPC